MPISNSNKLIELEMNVQMKVRSKLSAIMITVKLRGRREEESTA